MNIKLGVFFGGQSVEHEISVISALQAIEYIDKEKYDVVPIYISKDNNMYVGEKVGDISEYKNIKNLIDNSTRVILVNDESKVKLLKYPLKRFGNNEYGYIDIAFPIVHGTNVEDGTLQGYLKTLNLPFIGCDVTSSALGMDKYAMKAVFKEVGIPVLDGQVIIKKEYIDDYEKVIEQIEDRWKYPVIVKPINLGSSIGIKIAKDRKALKEAMEYAFTFAKRILIERAITNLKEINCSVLGDYEDAIASECEEPIGNDEILSYQDKYVSGSKSSKSGGMASLDRKIPANISKQKREEIRELAVTAFKVLNCNGVVRLDFMIDLDEDIVYLNEVNTIPGSLSFYLWSPVGKEYSVLLNELIELALKRERQEKDVTYSFDTNVLEGIKLGGAKGGKLGK